MNLGSINSSSLNGSVIPFSVVNLGQADIFVSTLVYERLNPFMIGAVTSGALVNGDLSKVVHFGNHVISGGHSVTGVLSTRVNIGGVTVVAGATTIAGLFNKKLLPSAVSTSDSLVTGDIIASRSLNGVIQAGAVAFALAPVRIGTFTTHVISSDATVTGAMRTKVNLTGASTDSIGGVTGTLTKHALVPIAGSVTAGAVFTGSLLNYTTVHLGGQITSDTTVTGNLTRYGRVSISGLVTGGNSVTGSLYKSIGVSIAGSTLSTVSVTGNITRYSLSIVGSQSVSNNASVTGTLTNFAKVAIGSDVVSVGSTVSGNLTKYAKIALGSNLVTPSATVTGEITRYSRNIVGAQSVPTNASVTGSLTRFTKVAIGSHDVSSVATVTGTISSKQFMKGDSLSMSICTGGLYRIPSTLDPENRTVYRAATNRSVSR